MDILGDILDDVQTILKDSNDRTTIREAIMNLTLICENDDFSPTQKAVLQEAKLRLMFKLNDLV